MKTAVKLLPLLICVSTGSLIAFAQTPESEPDNAGLYLKRGEIYRLHGQWQAAEADFDRAERLNPALFAVDLGRGKLFLASGRPRRALPALNRYLLRQKDAPEAWLTRARAWAAARRWREALNSLDEGVRRLGPLVSLELAALEIELRQKLYDDALARLDRVAANTPRRETWLARRGAILLQARRPREARQAFAEALKLLNTLPHARRNVAANQDLERQIRSGLRRANCPVNLSLSFVYPAWPATLPKRQASRTLCL
jgi:tetratricopeptide (TPR) repeat protein